MAKLQSLDEKYSGLFIFYCPGCKCSHWVQTDKPTAFSHLVWDFNNDFENPTIRPSIRVISTNAGKDVCCHFFITDGIIDYLQDCTHALAGKSTKMVEL